MKNRKAGFTLVEIIIVIAIIGILSTIAIMNYQSVRAKTQAAQISSNLHIIEDAIIAAIIDGKTVIDFGTQIDKTNVESSILKPYLTLANFTQVPDGITIRLVTAASAPPSFQVFVWVEGAAGTERILDELEKMFPKQIHHMGRKEFVIVDSSILAVKE